MGFLDLLFVIGFFLAGIDQAQLPAAAAALPQQTLPVQSAKPSSQDGALPKFSARTELVIVPVVVLQNHNPLKQLQLSGWIDPHVEGLTKDDFEIREDGESRAIASFEEIRGSKFVKPAIPEPGTYTNAILSDGTVSVTVILLDNIFTPYHYQHAAKGKLLRYLRTRYRGDRPTMLAVLDPDGLRIVHDFTSDPQLLITAAQKVKPVFAHDATADNQVQSEFTYELYNEIDPTKELSSVEDELGSSPSDTYRQMKYNERLAATFDQLQQLAHALAAVRGMKSLIWVSGGFTLPDPRAPEAPVLWQAYYDTVRLLTDAHVAIYPIDAALETDNPAYSSAQSRYSTARHGSSASIQQFMDIARRTGGDWCLLRKDPDLCFEKANDFGGEYYLLSYYIRSPEKQRWRTIEVKVHGNYQVKARTGYFAGEAPEDPGLRRRRDVALALSTPAELHALPITVKWENEAAPAPSTPRGSSLPDRSSGKRSFIIRINANALAIDAADRNHIQLSVVAAALDGHGKMLGEISQRLDLRPSGEELARLRSGGFVYRNQIELPEHTARARFLVRDDLSERIGTVSAPLP